MTHKKKGAQSAGNKNVAVYPKVTVIDDRPMTTTMNVAGVFKKPHKDVLKALKQVIITDEFSQRNYSLASYDDAQGKKRPMYNMTRDGFVFLVMGFTGAKARKFKIDYINAFNRMEAERAEHARAIPPPGDSEETRRALQAALSKALDALLAGQDQATLSKALDALIASQAQGTAVKEVQEKVRYLGNLSRTYLPQISKLAALTGQVTLLNGRLTEIAADQEGVCGWLEHIGDTQTDQLALIDRIASVQDNQSKTVAMVYEIMSALKGLPHQHRAPDVGPVVKALEGIQHGITNRMIEVTHLTTRIKTLEEKIDNAVKGIPPQGGVAGYMRRNLPKEKVGVPLITSILDNHNSPEAFLNACMEPENKAAIELRFLYRVYAAWTYERYSLPIKLSTFKMRLKEIAAEKCIAIENLRDASHLVGMRFKPEVIAPVQ